MVGSYNRKIQTHEGKRMNFNTTSNGTPMNHMSFGRNMRDDMKSKRNTEVIDDHVNINRISQGSAKIDFVYS
jgi:hypothetical protein